MMTDLRLSTHYAFLFRGEGSTGGDSVKSYNEKHGCTERQQAPVWTKVACCDESTELVNV